MNNDDLLKERDRLWSENYKMREMLKKVYYEENCPSALAMLIEPFIDPSDRYMKDDDLPLPMPGQEP